ncbi:MAG: hypothetical protein LBJ91_00655 [Clostridiales Family XIII bacterium]|jgi:hypothetical protein|nr:hypothetical protein [Clostridiales Family XIII bacterium]
MGKGVRTSIRVLIVALTLLAALYALGVVAFPHHLASDDGYGDRYDGVVVRGDYAGVVRIEYADGAVWEGPLAKGRFDGKGRYRSPEGWTFTGEFRNGAAHGPGMFELPDGTSYSFNIIETTERSR